MDFGGTTKFLAGRQYGYTYDNIGNRASATIHGDDDGNDRYTSTYTINDRNQVTNRKNSRERVVSGEATPTNYTVKVNGYEAIRQDTYYAADVGIPSWGNYLLSSTAVEYSNTTAVATNGPWSSFVPKYNEAYAYDDDGNLTSDARWGYTWKDRNQLTEMQMPNTPSGMNRQTLVLRYDALGRRKYMAFQERIGGSWQTLATHRYLYDGWNLIREEVDIVDGTNTIQYVNEHVWGLDLSGSMQGAGGVGGLLCSYQVSTGSVDEVYFPAYDGNGNVIGLLDSTGTVKGRFEYGPFGESVRTTDATILAGEAIPYSIKFSSKYQDAYSGHYYYGYRYCAPSKLGDLLRGESPRRVSTSQPPVASVGVMKEKMLRTT
jgi:hypothetical protein